MLQGKGSILIGDKRQSGVGTHAARVGSLVAIEGALVILRKRHRIHLLAIHEAHERELRTGEEVFHHHLAVAKVRVGEHILEGGLGLLQIFRNHHALAGSEPVVFEHRRERSSLHVSQSLRIVSKAAVAGGRNMVFHHQFLGELLAALNAGSRLRMTENCQSGGTESIHDSDCQRGFGAHHGEIYFMLQREGLKSLYVSIFQRHVLRLQADARIAGSAVDSAHLGAAAERVHYGMLAAASADHQHGFLEVILQIDLLAADGSFLGRKRIYKTHITSVFKMSYSSEKHHYSKFVRLGYGLGIAYASAGLHDCSHAVFRRQGYRVVERQEAVGCQDQAGSESGRPGLFEGDARGTHAVGLAGAYAYGVIVPHHGYRIGFHVLDYLPSEL